MPVVPKPGRDENCDANDGQAGDDTQGDDGYLGRDPEHGFGRVDHRAGDGGDEDDGCGRDEGAQAASVVTGAAGWLAQQRPPPRACGWRMWRAWRASRILLAWNMPRTPFRAVAVGQGQVVSRAGGVRVLLARRAFLGSEPVRLGFVL